jgi:hypothetical protein
MTDKLLETHCFIFNPKYNGGEELSLKTKVYANGDPGGFYFNQELILQSYCNSASFCLVGATISSQMLRKLADELEALENRAKEMTK